MRKEADDLNLATIKMHNIQKEYTQKVKARDGRFANSYAPETLRMAAFGGQIASARNNIDSAGRRLSQMAAPDMPTATGVTKVSPDRLTTIRQVKHYEDNQLRIQREQEKKAQLRADLEKQMQAKVFRRERDRLFMDDKALVTSKGMLKEVGHVVPD